jgi:hypothetical protein
MATLTEVTWVAIVVCVRVNNATIIDKGVVPEDHVVLAQHSSKSRDMPASSEQEVVIMHCPSHK